MSKVVRGVKNITKGYSNVQVKVRNGRERGHILSLSNTDRVTATSNDPWGPTGTDMSEIARLTFNELVQVSVAVAHHTDYRIALMTSTKLWTCSTSG